MLTRVAEVLRSSFRPEDVIGRPGGDEFVVYLRARGSWPHWESAVGPFAAGSAS